MMTAKRTNKIRKSFTIVLITITMMLLMACTASAAKINRKSASMKKGQSLQLKVSGTKKKASWKSSKKSVATVSKKGVVKAVAPGKATITAKFGGKKYTCKITVKTVTNNATQNGAVSSGSVAATAAPATSRLALDGNTSGMSAQEAVVYKKMLSMKKAYPEGMKWNNDNFYEWNAGFFCGGFGCSGFAFLLSDVAFGDTMASRHTNFGNIKVGDIIRYKNNKHSVVALKVTDTEVVVAEGNFNGSIHWGRVISMEEIRATGTYVMTRYA